MISILFISVGANPDMLISNLVDDLKFTNYNAAAPDGRGGIPVWEGIIFP